MLREPRKVVAFALAFGVALGACEGGDSGPTGTPAPEPPTEPTPDPNRPDVILPECEGPCPPALDNTRTVLAELAPPPISGGTLLLTRDGKSLVATDPDRDQLYVIDLMEQRLLHTRALQPGDEPGRVIEDAAGRIHVALRGGGAIASLTLEPDSAIERREVCALPRGLAFDFAADALHVACADGKLVSLPASGGSITRSVQLERDLRDVVMRDETIFVTRFRSAELLKLDAQGEVERRFTPPVFTQSEMLRSEGGMLEARDISNAPTVAWRTVDVPGKGTAILHQRARVEEVAVRSGSYAGGACGGSIVQTSVTIGVEGERMVSSGISGSTLAVDFAVDPAGTLLAVAAPGNWGISRFGQQAILELGQQVTLYSLTGSSPLNPFGDSSLRQPAGSVATNPCMGSLTALPTLPGQVTAVTFVSSDVLAVQEREPAAISLIDVRASRLLTRLDLGQPSRFDTGHALFHMRAPVGLACASCHAEASDDAHVWTFADIGPRRTQDLRGGFLGTEPLHWNGDMRDFDMLVERVLAERMGSFHPAPGQIEALAHWIDRQPSPAAAARDKKAAARGKTLFESEAVGCATCHSGARLTNNQSADVGTGGQLQVPSLRGVSFRTPLMHDGCAPTLRARFEGPCGGTSHGNTAQLSAPQLDDLIAYLETL